MAEQVLKTKIKLKYLDFATWSAEAFKSEKPLKGEVWFCEIRSTQTSPVASPAPLVLFKVGDGEHTFGELDWVSAKAADVYSWAKKSEDEFKAWVKTLVTVNDIDLSNYYTKGKVDELLAANSAADQAHANSVAATAKSEAIAAAATDATTKANTAETNAKAHAEEKVTALANGAVAANATAIATEKSRAEGEEARIEGLLDAYKTSNNNALDAVRQTAEAARTEDEVDDQIDAKITALNLATTYEPIGAEDRAKAYVDQKIGDADLGQYTTEQEVKDIVDGVIAGAVDGDTITGLANLVEYLHTHGGEAAEMGAAIDVLEGKVDTIEGKPAYGITASQISNWDGEVGAKALAGTKLDATTFTNYENAHKNDYTNKQIDDAIDADVAKAIEDEVARANGAYDAKGAAATAKSEAIAYADGLAGNYATAAQGAKADTALQEIEVGTGLKVSDKTNNKQRVEIDDTVIFILECNY